MVDVSLPSAFAAGLVSAFSPCVLPLVPPYLCYLAGTSLEMLADKSEPRARREIILAALLFVSGFATVFVSFGATASLLGVLLRRWSSWFGILAGVGIVGMGMHFLGVLRVSLLFQEKRLTLAKPPALWSAYVMGLAFAFGWTPCIGPILATILAVASTQDTAAHGAFLLWIYACGLGVPFILAALMIERFLAVTRYLRDQFVLLEKCVGLGLIATGFAFLIGSVKILLHG